MNVIPGTLYTINDLSEIELEKKRDEFIDENFEVLSKYFSKLDLQKIRNTFFSKLFGKNSEIKLDESLCECSEFRFSLNKINIPKNINLVCELLLKNKSHHDGIFRVNSLPENIKSFISTVKSIASGDIDREIGVKMIESTFDITDMAESYKVLFRKCGSPIFPDKFVKLAARTHKATVIEHKLLCIKAILFGLPKKNRMILENCVYCCSAILDKLDRLDIPGANGKSELKDGDEKKVESFKFQNRRQMDILGLGVVMTPNLIDFNISDLEFDLVKILSEFICFLFEHFQDIIKID
jgi:hypothetical protein